MFKTVVAFALLCATSLGAQPSLKITSTSVTTPGDILRVTAVAPEAKSYVWRVWTDIKDNAPTEEQVEAIKAQAEAAGLIVSRSETVEEKTYQLECDGGKSIDLPSWAGQKWIIFCCVANATGDQASATTVVAVPGVPEPPTPPHPDPPKPDPVPTSDLTTLVMTELKPIVAANPSIVARVKLGMVAVAYRQVAGEIKDGKLTTIDQVLDRTKSLVMSSMTNDYDRLWKQPTRQIELKLESIKTTLVDAKSHIQPWIDVATGIEKSIGAN